MIDITANRYCTDPACGNLDPRVKSDDAEVPPCSRCGAPTRMKTSADWELEEDEELALLLAQNAALGHVAIDAGGGVKLTSRELEAIAAEKNREMAAGEARHREAVGASPGTGGRREVVIRTAQEDRVAADEHRHQAETRRKAAGITPTAQSEYKRYASDAARRGERPVTLGQFIRGG